ncbi:M48 family metalloprotease [Siphonobacter curvatus]|uniref:Peptidase M48 domain-containing protein n=1 Tax=Siphonobacter curvatus TaxID=2094562 RepID=A0A2S7IFJ2_9BACT|nr:M48 family metalloprotease [Siphonobacter curvatus]PQA53717.1 hypothetical protein C5O19_23860 [Siphonobacter curvatus]
MNSFFKQGLLWGLLAVSGPVMAQDSTDNQEDRFPTWSYGSQKLQKGPCDVYLFKSNQHAETVVDNILKSAGMGFGKRNFQVVECPNTDNCYATIINGTRYVVYDNAFLKLVENRTQTDWSAVSIMAHEIGHHILGHTSDGTGSRPDKELQADYFSGFVLHNLGGSLENAQIAIKLLQNDEGDYTHPPKRDRLSAIEKGWREADNFYPRIASKEPVSSPTPSPSVAKLPSVPSVTKVETKVPEVAQTGCLAGNCDNGTGLYVNRKTLEKYEGDWKESRPNGFGTQYYSTGKKKYEGTFLNGRFDGKGTLWYTNGAIYAGDFSAGQCHGKGMLRYANGDRYLGDFKNGYRHGKGKYIYASGYEEVLYYLNDKRQPEK